jgi:hypothetical protein
MANPPQKEPKQDGALFDDFFESLGKKAENLNITEQNDKTATQSDAAESKDAPEEEVEQKVVDEIESLCMNCHENVSIPAFSFSQPANLLQGNHSFITHSNTLFPRDHTHVLLLSALQLQELRDPICRRDPTERLPLRTASEDTSRLCAASRQVRYLCCEIHRIGY